MVLQASSFSAILILLLAVGCSTPGHSLVDAGGADGGATDVPSPFDDMPDLGPPAAAPWIDSQFLPGEPSSIRAADLDADGFTDLVTIITADQSLRVRLGDSSLLLAVAILWGNRTDRTYFPLPVAQGSCTTLHTRDSSTEILHVVDFDRDARLDVVTAGGVLLQAASNEFTWHEFPEGAANALQPLVIVDSASGSLLLRGRVDGRVDACADTFECELLEGQGGPSCDATMDCAIFEMAAGDFDHDGLDDVLAGVHAQVEPFRRKARFWRGRDDFTQFEELLGVDIEDLEVGDVDLDGYPDLFAQRLGTISDFPSQTDLWISDPEEVRSACLERSGPFCLAQTYGNYDNHADNAALSDLNADGCLDLTRIGVDTAVMDVLLGERSGSSCIAPLPNRRVLVAGLDAVIGAQHLDANGDGMNEWVLRTRNELTFVHVPELTSESAGVSCTPSRQNLDLWTDTGTLVRLLTRSMFEGADRSFTLDTGSATTFVHLFGEGADYERNVASIGWACGTRTVDGRRGIVPDMFGESVAGSIGADVLLEGPSRLNLVGYRIEQVSDETIAALGEEGSHLPFENVLGHIIVTVAIGGEAPRRMMLDTGSPHILLLGEAGQPGDVAVTTSDATGTPLTMYYGNTHVAFGPNNEADVSVLRAPSFPYFEETVRLLGGDIHGLVGLSAIDRRVIGIAPTSSEIIVSQRAAQCSD